MAFKTRQLKHYWSDEEFRYYLCFLLIASLLVTMSLIIYGLFTLHPHAFVKSLFNVISLATTTGYISAPFNTWPTYIPVFVMLLAIIGGCAASTSGGIKVLRALLVFKQSRREITRLLHPHAITPIKFGKHPLPEPILQSMWGFISVFIALFLFLMIVLMALGNDFITSFSAITATLANAGTGIGHIHTSFAELSLPSKWLLMFSMLAGRLEIFSLLILFSRQFWVK